MAYNRDVNTKEEELKRGFICINCKKWVPVSKHTGTVNRNHCPHCLWSKHVDTTIAGDRMSGCNNGMKPIALTLKKSRINKWGEDVVGEIMLIHKCIRCGKISINRILAEDDQKEIMNLFEVSKNMSEDKKKKLENGGISILTEEDREELEKQIFGKS